MAQVDAFQSFYSEQDGDPVNTAETIRRAIDGAHRNLIFRETLPPPEKPKPPPCRRCGQRGAFCECDSATQRQPSQRAIQKQEEARMKFERMGLLPRSQDHNSPLS
jgi:hypothetical protein